MNPHFHVRSNASSGLWLMFLLPAAILLSALKHPVIISHIYELVAVFALSLIVISIGFILNIRENKFIDLKSKWVVIPGILLLLVFRYRYHEGWIFSIFGGCVCSELYVFTYTKILQICKKCFTLGEASIVSQSIVILIFSTFRTVCQADKNILYNNQISTLIIQLFLSGLIFTGVVIYTFGIQKPFQFYSISILLITFLVILPLHYALQRSPILWILWVVFENSFTIGMIVYWTICCGVSFLTLRNQVVTSNKASTSRRKIFHALIVVVFLPGIVFECLLIYLASGIVLGLFIILEGLRLLHIPPFGRFLQNSFLAFSDSKDEVLALSPIYLLVGCSLPLWIHPFPCDILGSSYFTVIPLLSGLLSTGIGDAAASVVGSKVGKHYWSGSSKTKEGTLACILSQFLLLAALDYFDLIAITFTMNIKIALGVIITSIVEAKTDQLDNLVLPLIMYIILL